MAVIIVSTHYTGPRWDGQAELAWVAWLNTNTVYPRMVTHLGTILTGRRVTSLTRPATLPLRYTLFAEPLKSALYTMFENSRECNYDTFCCQKQWLTTLKCGVAIAELSLLLCFQPHLLKSDLTCPM